MPLNFLACLPVVAFGLLVLISWRENTSGRVAFLHAAIIWAVLVTGVTEALSVFHALTWASLTSAWMLINVAAVLYVVRVRLSLRAPGAWAREAFSQLSDLDIAFLTGTLAIVAAVGFVAIVAPPNTIDCLQYHMPRIVHWLQNQSVGFYSTHELKQLKNPPWAEYAILQFHGLSGGDRFDNLVQWFSLIGSAIGASLLAQLLYADTRSQVLAGVLSVTIPEGILEASGAKNDYVAALWLVSAVYFALCYKKSPSPQNLLALGCTLGLACLTKPTALILAPPVVAAVVFARPTLPWRMWARGLAVVAILAVALNAPQFIRNYRLFHSVLGPSAETPPNTFKYTNDTFGVLPTVSNVVRNLALHAATPSPAVNLRIETAIDKFLRALGQDPNDRRTTWDFTPFHVDGPSLHEAVAGNPLHCLVIFAVCGLLFWRWRSVENRPALWLAAGLVASFLMFCAVFRWQPWHTRLHLPLFVVWSGVAGAVLARYLPKSATGLLGMVLLLVATPDVFANQLRPLVTPGGSTIFTLSRDDLYFYDLGGLLPSYRDAVRFVRTQHCDGIGLDMSASRLEYPLQVLLGNLNGSQPIRNVNVANVSNIYAAASDSKAPCVICPECAIRKAGWAPMVRQFRALNFFGDVAVLTGRGGRKPSVCRTEFSGWHDLEKNAAGDWWRWSAGDGLIRVTASQDLDASLEGVISSIQQPDSVHVLIDGQAGLQFRITTPEGITLKGIVVHLKKGLNTLAFVSEKPGVRIPTDTRLLAIYVRNLELRTEGEVGCPLEQ